MKQNITLSVEKDLIQKARVLAAKNNSSISQMLSQNLKNVIYLSENYDSSKKRALYNLKSGFHLDGGITVSREALHER